MSYLDGEVGWESLVESEMNGDVTVKEVVAGNMKGWRRIALNRARWASKVGEVSGVRRQEKEVLSLEDEFELWSLEIEEDARCIS